MIEISKWYLLSLSHTPPQKHLKNEPTDIFQSYYQTILTFSEFISNNTDASRQLLPINSIRVHSKQYWHFQRVINQTIANTFSEFISNNTDTFRELLQNNSKHFFQSLYQTILTISESYCHTIVNTFFRVHITQHWQFQSYYHTIIHNSKHYYYWFKGDQRNENAND